MANARFRALGSNHYPLPVYSVITMTTTQSLPSFVAKTIEILIKAIPPPPFLSVVRKHPDTVIQKYITRNSLGTQKIFSPSHMTLLLHPQSPVSILLNNSDFTELINLDLSGYLIQHHEAV